MSEPPDGVTTAIQRQMLRVVVRNSARSVPLLMVAVLFVAWLGWQGGHLWTAAITLVMGAIVSAWRLAAFPARALPQRTRAD